MQNLEPVCGNSRAPSNALDPSATSNWHCDQGTRRLCGPFPQALSYGSTASALLALLQQTAPVQPLEVPPLLPLVVPMWLTRCNQMGILLALRLSQYLSPPSLWTCQTHLTSAKHMVHKRICFLPGYFFKVCDLEVGGPNPPPPRPPGGAPASQQLFSRQHLQLGCRPCRPCRPDRRIH